MSKLVFGMIDKKTFELNDKIITDFEQILKIQFVQELEKESVCYANHNSELRNEFKQVFTRKDILDYFYAVFYSSEGNLPLTELYPKTNEEFWNRVVLGEKLKQ